MGRRKGSLNKKSKPVQLDFDNKLDFEDESEVCMTQEVQEMNKEEKEIVEIEEKSLVVSDPIQEKEEELEMVNHELDLARMELENAKLEIELKKQELLNLPKENKTSNAPNDTPAVSIKNVSLQSKIEQMKAKDSVLVTGKFYNLRVKGKSEKLPYMKYGDEPVKWHTFEHGKVYTIPRGFADQINGGTESDPFYYTPHFYKNEGAIIDPENPGTGIHSVDSSDKKYSFVPVHFAEERAM